MTKSAEVQNIAERSLVRSVYKNAHCRDMGVGDGRRFFVFYTDKRGSKILIGISKISRADAWLSASLTISAEVMKKLES